MSMYIGSDNWNNKILHVTAGRREPAELKSGIQRDTIFHSALPLIQVLGDVSVGVNRARSGSLVTNNVTNKLELREFVVPQAVRDHLSKGFTCIVQGTDDNNATGSILDKSYSVSVTAAGNMLPWPQPTSKFSYANFKLGGSVTSVGNYISSGGASISENMDVDYGIFCAPNTQTWDHFYEDKYVNGERTKNWTIYPIAGKDATLNGSGAITGTLYADQCGYLTQYSKYIYTYKTTKVGRTSRNGIYPKTIRFIMLNLKHTGNGFHVDGSVASREVYIDKSRININGADLLSNKRFLYFTGQARTNSNLPGDTSILSGTTFDSFWTPNVTCPLGATMGNGVHPQQPKTAGTPGAWSVQPVKAGNTIRSVIGGGAGDGGDSSLGGYYNGLRNQPIASGYGILSVPKINGVNFTENQLIVNGNTTLYSPSWKPTAFIGSNITLNFGGFRFADLGSPTSGGMHRTNTYWGSYHDFPNETKEFMHLVVAFKGSQNGFKNTIRMNGSTANININNWTDDSQRDVHMYSLKVNQFAPLFSVDIDTLNFPYMHSCSMVVGLYRPSSNPRRVQLVGNIVEFRNGIGTNSYTTIEGTIPTFQISVGNLVGPN